MLVLFTPAMPPISTDLKSKPQTKDPADPFEPLGRALSARHSRVRHVPYVPKVGLTNLHLPFIRQAHAIIVVVCEPPGSPKAKDESVANQERFAAAVSSALVTLRPTDGAQVTTSLVQCCGNGRASQPQQGFQNILQCPGYSQADQEAAVRLLMGR